MTLRDFHDRTLAAFFRSGKLLSPRNSLQIISWLNWKTLRGDLRHPASLHCVPKRSVKADARAEPACR